MDFSLSDDQKLIRDTVRQFMEAELRPVVRQYEHEEHFPADEIRRLGELGCCGMLIPEEWGGAGVDTISYVLMLEEVARVDAATAVALSVTNSVAGMPLWNHGNDSQKRRYLRRLASGEILGGFCLTEPQAGSDAAAIQTRATLHGNVYHLNGTKTWVTNGGVAGVYLVFAKTDPAAGARGVTAFLVEPTFPGFRVGRYEDKMGIRTSRTAELVFNDCEVPAENRVGEEGRGLKIALEALDGGRVGIAAQALGIAQGAMEEAVGYAKQRRAFGKAIGEFQAIQWMIADMQTEIEAARGLVYYAAWLREEGSARAGVHASRAKLYASEMVNRVVYKAVQVHGSVGYSREMNVERMYRDARVISIYEGTSEIQRLVIARDLLGLAGDPRREKQSTEAFAAKPAATTGAAAREPSSFAAGPLKGGR
ncbi:MAG TPA: acyl-CoA dehydrogenase family protein [Candidatus Dormibacteraeota bacterium]|nr:acyl-CoA dehydrogenase family protein [Candidatus Dormibacteraeota bacterium]